jgi:hypothetical protein
LDPPEIEGMNVYEDKPDLSRQFEAAGIRGVRRDQYAMIGVRGGPVEVPKLELPWWDIEAGEWRVATLPSRTIEILAAEVEAVVAPPTEAQTATDTPDNAENAQQLLSDDFWKRASQLIAAAWLLTIVAWWWSSRERVREPREPEAPPIHKQQAKFLKAARKAATAGDKVAVRAALLEWARLEWPDDSPRSIGDIAQRVAAPLSDELQLLSSSSYSGAASEWDGSELAKAMRSIHTLTADNKVTTAEPLPPLMPPGS